MRKNEEEEEEGEEEEEEEEGEKEGGGGMRNNEEEEEGEMRCLMYGSIFFRSINSLISVRYNYTNSLLK